MQTFFRTSEQNMDETQIICSIRAVDKHAPAVEGKKAINKDFFLVFIGLAATLNMLMLK